jgi:hypothetical protein
MLLLGIVLRRETPKVLPLNKLLTITRPTLERVASNSLVKILEMLDGITNATTRDNLLNIILREPFMNLRIYLSTWMQPPKSKVFLLTW